MPNFQILQIEQINTNDFIENNKLNILSSETYIRPYVLFHMVLPSNPCVPLYDLHCENNWKLIIPWDVVDDSKFCYCMDFLQS